MRPTDAEYAPYYNTYIRLVPEPNVVPILEEQPGEMRALLGGLTREREMFRYAPDKWSVRQVIGHITDTERVFGFRAFCFSRGEHQALPGFDQDEYMKTSASDKQPLGELIEEFAVVREANLCVLRNLSQADLDRIGTASGHHVSVRALTYMMAGHVRHHLALLRERYL